MANPYHHALSSVKKWGGRPEDYMPIHEWFDETKAHVPDFRHRALRHHSEGIFLMQSIFGATITVHVGTRCMECRASEKSGIVTHEDGCPGSLGYESLTKEVPTRWVGEQHVQEDMGFIPTAADWLKHIQGEPWMQRGARPLSRELENAT